MEERNGSDADDSGVLGGRGFVCAKVVSFWGLKARITCNICLVKIETRLTIHLLHPTEPDAMKATCYIMNRIAVT